MYKTSLLAFVCLFQCWSSRIRLSFVVHLLLTYLTSLFQLICCCLSFFLCWRWFIPRLSWKTVLLVTLTSGMRITNMHSHETRVGLICVSIRVFGLIHWRLCSSSFFPLIPVSFFVSQKKDQSWRQKQERERSHDCHEEIKEWRNKKLNFSLLWPPSFGQRDWHSNGNERHEKRTQWNFCKCRSLFSVLNLLVSLILEAL